MSPPAQSPVSPPAQSMAAPYVHPFPLPPRLWPFTPREPMATGISRARWLLLGYWSLLISGYVVLGGSIAAYGHLSGTDLPLLLGILGTSFLGVASGNLLGVARVRPWVVNLAVTATTVLSCTGVALLGPYVVMFGLTFVWSLGCGHLTLQRRFSLATLWIPVICWAGGMIEILEHNGRLHAWQAGHKAGVWQPLTLALLFAMVVEVFLFLAGQEHYHTLVWQAYAANAPPTVIHHRGGASRLTGRGLVAILTLAAAVCASTALIAPYLWRTETRDGHRERDGGQRQRPRHEGRPGASDYRPDTDWEGVRQALERAAREARRQGGALLPFVPLFLLNRPARRWWRLRQLRKPLWPVSPSRRAADLWRYVRIALGDAGLAPKPGESIDDTVARVDAGRDAAGLGPARGLAEAAEVYQRVRYGLGIPEGALEALHHHAVTAHTAVRERMSLWARVRAWWRTLEA